MHMGACVELVISSMLTLGLGFTFPDISTLQVLLWGTQNKVA